MPKNAANDYTRVLLDRLIPNNTIGIAGYRADITQEQANELIRELQESQRNSLPVASVPWGESPTPPQNRLAMSLLTLKQRAAETAHQLRVELVIPDNQMLTRSQLTRLITRLLDLPTIPGKEAELRDLLENGPKEWTWAIRV